MKKLIVASVILLSVFVGSNIFVSSKVSAAVAQGCENRNSFLLFPPWYAYLEVGPKTGSTGVVDPCAIIGPTESNNNVFGAPDEFSFRLALPRIGLAILEILLRIAGIITVVYVIYGGFRYITSQGEPEALKQARGTIINALIGMAISILAVTIVAFVGGVLF